MEALQEQPIVCAPKSAKQGQLGQHRTTTGGEIRQAPRLPKRLTPTDAKHVRPPSRPREHLPKSVNGPRGVSYAWDVRPISSSGLSVDKAARLLFVGEQLAPLVDEGSAA